MFHGSLVALVTPMQEDGSIDFDSLTQLINWHIEQGTDGFVVMGTTGESAGLTYDERSIVIRHTMEAVAGRVPVIAGTGSNATTNAIRLTRHATELGVAGCMLVAPYYNKPTQEGLYLHFKTIAESTEVPLILYNVPSRTGCDIEPATVARLAVVSNIVGLKEATGSIDRLKALKEYCGGSLDFYSGDDLTALEFLKEGGRGVISVTANVKPKAMHDLCELVHDELFDDAKALNDALMPLHKALFIESNPIPVKWALNKMGLIPPGIRLPLTELSSDSQEQLCEVLKEQGVLNES